MEEDEIEIRGVAELDSAELPVGDYGKAPLAGLARTPRHAVPCRHDVPGDDRNLGDDGLGGRGEVVAHLHEGERVSDVAGRDPEELDLLELAHGVHLLLGVVRRDAHQELAQSRRDVIKRHQLVEALRDHELVKEDRVLAELVHHVLRGAREAHHLVKDVAPLEE